MEEIDSRVSINYKIVLLDLIGPKKAMMMNDVRNR